MQVTVKGVITSIQERKKDDREYTELYLAQPGERNQVAVRLNGHRANSFQPFDVQEFTGTLMIWKTRDGVGTLVMADDH